MKFRKVRIRDKTKTINAHAFAHFHYHGLVKFPLIADEGRYEILDGSIDILDERSMLQQVLYDIEDGLDQYRRTYEAQQGNKSGEDQYP